MTGLTARRLLPLAVVGGLLAAVAITAVVASPGVHSVPLPQSMESAAAAVRSHQRQFDPTGHGLLSAPPSSWHAPAWLTVLIGAICGTLVALLVGFLVWRLIHMWLSERAAKLAAATPSGAPLATRRAAVLAAVDASIAALASEDGDARSAVIACWVRLEEVAALAGTHRETGDTSAELVDRLLSEHQVSKSVLQALAELYRTARFSTRTIESTMRDQARAALGRLRDELAASRSGPLAAEPVLAGSTVRRPRPSTPREPAS